MSGGKNSNDLYRAIDKLLNYSLPTGVQKLTIELEVEKPALITCLYIPNVSETLESDITAHGVVVEQQFNVVPIKKKKR